MEDGHDEYLGSVMTNKVKEKLMLDSWPGVFSRLMDGYSLLGL